MENCAIAKSCPSYTCTGTESSYNTVAVYVGTVRSVGCVVRVLCIAFKKGRRGHWEGQCGSGMRLMLSMFL